MKELKFYELFVGMKVVDEEGNIGEIIECNNIHNIDVKFKNSIGLFCLDPNCESYSPLFQIESDEIKYNK